MINTYSFLLLRLATLGVEGIQVSPKVRLGVGRLTWRDPAQDSRKSWPAVIQVVTVTSPLIVKPNCLKNELEKINWPIASHCIRSSHRRARGPLKVTPPLGAALLAHIQSPLCSNHGEVFFFQMNDIHPFLPPITFCCTPVVLSSRQLQLHASRMTRSRHVYRSVDHILVAGLLVLCPWARLPSFHTRTGIKIYASS